MKTVFVCCFQKSRDYSAEYVYHLKRGISENTTKEYPFICFTDEDLDGIETRPFLFNVPGWWNQVNVFNLHSFDQAVYFDLDTVIRKNIDWITGETRHFWALPRVRTGEIQTGVMKFNGGHASRVLPAFLRWYNVFYERGLFSPPIKGEGKSVALNFFKRVFPNWKALPLGVGQQINIYKNHFRKNPPDNDPSIVCFSCNPRPHRVNWLE